MQNWTFFFVPWFLFHGAEASDFADAPSPWMMKGAANQWDRGSSIVDHRRQLEEEQRAFVELRAQLEEQQRAIDSFICDNDLYHDIYIRFLNLKRICGGLLREAESKEFDKTEWLDKVTKFLEEVVELVKRYVKDQPSVDEDRSGSTGGDHPPNPKGEGVIAS